MKVWLARGNTLPVARSGRPRNRGVALIVVLWISLGLTSLAIYFGHAMKLEYRAAGNTLAQIQSAHAVEAAHRYILYALANMVEETGEFPDPETFECEAVEVDDSWFWLVGRDSLTPDEERDVSTDGIAFGLIDEASKLNLNSATQEMLEALPGMTPELAGAIVDWRDSDSDPAENGAEEESYAMRDPSGQCKNGAFETIEELRLLLGGDYDVLYGEDRNGNAALEMNEDDADESDPEDNQDEAIDFGVLEYLTVFSREPNKTAEGEDRVNVSDSDSGQELSELLEKAFGSARADEILSNAGLQSQGGRGGQGSQSPDYKSLLEFYLASGMAPDEFAQVEDSLTVEEKTWIQGRINVNTAPEAVLACIPGVGEGGAADLAAYRLDKDEDDEEFATVAWVAGVLGEDDAIEAGPYLTTNSCQFSADIVAVGRNGRGFRRELFVYDTTQEEPMAIFRRDLTRRGWPLSESVRQDILEQAREEGS
jgi:type II secretory pathway component PulK